MKYKNKNKKGIKSFSNVVSISRNTKIQQLDVMKRKKRKDRTQSKTKLTKNVQITEDDDSKEVDKAETIKEHKKIGCCVLLTYKI